RPQHSSSPVSETTACHIRNPCSFSPRCKRWESRQSCSFTQTRGTGPAGTRWRFTTRRILSGLVSISVGKHRRGLPNSFFEMESSIPRREKRNFEIGQSNDSCISNPEIRNLRLDLDGSLSVQFKIFDFGFEMQ